MKKITPFLILLVAAGCNQLEDIPFVDEEPPVLLAAENLDLDSDEFTDTIRLTFDERVRDETVTEGDFSIVDIGNITFHFDTNGDTSHDEILHLTIDDGVYSMETAFDLTYTQGTLEDLAGNLLASLVITTIPTAAPPP